jgi:hypothetical protein
MKKYFITVAVFTIAMATIALVGGIFDVPGFTKKATPSVKEHVAFIERNTAKKWETPGESILSRGDYEAIKTAAIGYFDNPNTTVTLNGKPITFEPFISSSDTFLVEDNTGPRYIDDAKNKEAVVVIYDDSLEFLFFKEQLVDM